MRDHSNCHHEGIYRKSHRKVTLEGDRSREAGRGPITLRIPFFFGFNEEFLNRQQEQWTIFGNNIQSLGE